MSKFDADNALYGHLKPNMANRSALESIQASLGVIDDAFSEDSLQGRAVDTDKLKDMVYRTALHESAGGQFNSQIGGGPGSGYYQIEPFTARDIARTFSKFGNKAISIINRATGNKYTKSDLTSDFDAGGISNDEWSEILKHPEVGALMAGAKYLQATSSQKKGVSDYFLK